MKLWRATTLQHQAIAKPIAGPLVSSGLSKHPLHIALRLDMKFAEFPEALSLILIFHPGLLWDCRCGCLTLV